MVACLLSASLQGLPNTQVAQTLAGVITSLFTFFAGFLLSPAKVPGADGCSELVGWLWSVKVKV